MVLGGLERSLQPPFLPWLSPVNSILLFAVLRHIALGPLGGASGTLCLLQTLVPTEPASLVWLSPAAQRGWRCWRRESVLWPGHMMRKSTPHAWLWHTCKAVCAARYSDSISIHGSPYLDVPTIHCLLVCTFLLLNALLWFSFISNLHADCVCLFFIGIASLSQPSW